MSGFVLHPDLSPVLSRFMQQRSPVSSSRVNGAGRPSLWSALVDEVGVAGLLVPGELGGQDASLFELGAAVYELGRYGWSGPVIAGAGVTVHLLSALDPDDGSGLRAAVAAGRVVVTTLHEDGLGEQLEVASTVEGAFVSGTKTFVDSGTHAEALLVPAVLDGTGCLVVVDAMAGGVRVEAMG